MGTLAHDDTIRGDAAERVHHDLEQDVAPDTTSLERVGILGLGTVQELGRVVREPPRGDRVEGLQDRYLTGDRPGGGEAEQNRRRPHSHHLMTTERQRPYGASPGGEVTTSFPNKPCSSSKGPAVKNRDRKSTRLNSSHSQISYAVFCLKKKKTRKKKTESI